jgi:spore coat protein A, manganese oxidase
MSTRRRTSGQWRALRFFAIGLIGVAGLSCDGQLDATAEGAGVEQIAQAVTLGSGLPPRLNAATIPKFVNQLSRPFTFSPTLIRNSSGKVIRKEYTVEVAKFGQQLLPDGFPPTPLFGFGGNVVMPDGSVQFVRTAPGPKFEQTKDVPALIRWRNRLLGEHPLPVDPTLDWANPNNFPRPNPPFTPFPPGYPQAQQPIAQTTHTHGIEVKPEFDGTPDTWFTATGAVGPEFVSRDYLQPSSNQSSAFWYHDHAFGVTRLGMYLGLAGFSILRDPANPLDAPSSPLPSGEFEVPLIVQDRSFRTDGSLFYPNVGDNPDVNPYWVLMFDGDTNIVNGKVWPNMDVKRRTYRFRVLNAANQRFYQFSFSNGMPFKVIGSDGGYLRTARTVTSVLLGVTERTDILVDFSQLPVGTKVILRNTAQKSPPIGEFPDPNLDGTVMQFTVVDSPAVAPPVLPATLNTIATLTPNRPKRILIQNTQNDEAGRILRAMLDGRLFHDGTTELPLIGATEDWEFVNTTPLDHNKHVHLVEFLLVDRRPIDAARYLADWLAANGDPPFDHPAIKLPVEPYITGPATGPAPEESGWKDTIRTPAGMATRIRIRWNPQQLPSGAGAPGVNLFPFDPTYGIGYVWHCHLLEHEDNEMMRQMTVVKAWKSGTSYKVGDIVDFNGVDYQVRIAHTAQFTPPQTFNLWERVNNMNGDWAAQTIYKVGHRVRFQGHIYRAIQQSQGIPGQEPPRTPALWELIL